MRQLLSILFIVSFSIFTGSCKKNTPDLSQAIIGTWELRKDIGGIMGGTRFYAPGNGSIIKFTSTNFERYDNGQLGENGIYNIIKDKAHNGGMPPDRLVFNSSNSPKFFVKMEQSQLMISIDADDSNTWVYDRIQ
jgi:hypothetical protein